ncbi:molybdate ABC transporter permease subunit [Coleofasciculus sp. LEGE 07081]|uniref:molybdate ABC transporter permease subunit n=1 Tax=unclassified Coleofasciculus TaxID=2692782 RepID=UPI00187DFA40|nr:molybdate ABC transporter permease subunit [Coleofasciculus sp. LEGE 07081]MBE9149293.1 molybdate ABC transporter permease subunit [Coleofasciculus sp. LEGE 07092]
MEMDLSPLWISLKTALVATIFAFFTGMMAAWWMHSYQGKGRGFIDGIFTLPLVLPPTVTGFLLLLLLGRNSPVGQVLRQFGINFVFTWSAAVIASSVVAFPLMYKTTLGAFEQVETNLLNSARTLGVPEWKIFGLVLLPLAGSGVVAGTILSFARALGEFGATLMVAGSIPGKTQTIPIAIFFEAEAGRIGQALNWVLIMVAISLAVITAINYWSSTQSLKNTVPPKASTFTKKLLNFLILGQFQDVEFSDGNASGKTRSVGADSPLSEWNNKIGKSALTKGDTHETKRNRKQNVELLVNLQKNFPSFKLETTFSADGNPLGLLGASGSGKSMTLRCIAGLETPTEGRIILNGRVLFDSQRGINVPSRKRRIGLVFQNYALFPHLTIAQNIAFGLQNLPKVKRIQRVSKYLNLMQLKGMEDRYPHQISGGQQQRVALARALAIEPEALLLDEPLSALDTYLRSQIEQLLIEVLSRYKGVTLFITHKLEEAYRICHNLLILSDGKIIADGSKEEIFERPPTFKAAQVTECKNFSHVQTVDSQHIEALDWGCILHIVEPIPDLLTYVGIRAHHLTFSNNPNQKNTFPCWLVKTSETQHRVTLYIRLNSPPDGSRKYHLQAEVYKEKWANLKDRPFPWYIRLDPLRLILME